MWAFSTRLLPHPLYTTHFHRPLQFRQQPLLLPTPPQLPLPLQTKQLRVPESSSSAAAAIKHGRDNREMVNRVPPSEDDDDDEEKEEEDKRFMREAIIEAAKAASKGEVPVGAVIVFQGDIIARAHNLVESKQDPTAHAEMICIRNAAKLLGGWRLLDSTLYVTLEPCPMCAGALLQARVSALVWGAPNTLLGADGSWVSLFPRLPSTSPNNTDELKNGKNCIHPFNGSVKVRRGILASECSEIMKDFFRRRRKQSPVRQAKLVVPSYLEMKRNVFQNITLLFKFVKFFKFFNR